MSINSKIKKSALKSLKNHSTAFIIFFIKMDLMFKSLIISCLLLNLKKVIALIIIYQFICYIVIL